ncbi:MULTISPECIES: hypothetical protein [unclassified Bradyrhizobium]|nr:MULTISPECIES: hypothetical protein [unclassified Bradyrhizobium]
MVVLSEEAGRNHFVGECVVDDVGLATGRGFQFLERADRENTVA